MATQSIIISNNKVTRRVKTKDILWVERNLRKLQVVTFQGTYEYYERLENVLPFLDSCFYPCLKGCYINFELVESMQEQKICFDKEKFLILGRRNFSKTRRAFKNYLKNDVELNKSACN